MLYNLIAVNNSKFSKTKKNFFLFLIGLLNSYVHFVLVLWYKYLWVLNRIEKKMFLPVWKDGEDLGDELLVVELLPGLHDPHNGGLDQQLAVFLYVLVCHLGLLALVASHRNVDVHLQLFVLIPAQIDISKCGLYWSPRRAVQNKIINSFLYLLSYILEYFICKLRAVRMGPATRKARNVRREA